MYYLNNDVETDTRYDTIKFIEFKTDNIDPLDSFFLTNIMNLPAIGTYTIVGEAERPDLVSYQLYEDTQYWWILMLYNKILDISELKPGTDLTYPDKSLLEALYQKCAMMEKVK